MAPLVDLVDALAVMGGAMGGVKGIPSDEMDKVKSKIDAAAKKFKVGEYSEKGAYGYDEKKRMGRKEKMMDKYKGCKEKMGPEKMKQGKGNMKK